MKEFGEVLRKRFLTVGQRLFIARFTGDKKIMGAIFKNVGIGCLSVYVQRGVL
jgi:hypothetical protein